LLFGIVSAGAILVLAGPAAAQGPPTLTPNPTSGPPGTSLTLTATNFDEGLPCLGDPAVITFFFGGTQVGQAPVSASASVNLTVPTEASYPDTVQVEATCPIDANQPKMAFSSFIVEAPPPPPTTTTTTTLPPTTTTTVRPTTTTTKPPPPPPPPPHTTTTAPHPTTTTTTTTTTVPPTTTTTAPAVRTLALDRLSVPPGGPIEATGEGCDPSVPVTLTVGKNVVAKTVSTKNGSFVIPLQLTSIQVGPHQVLAQCGVELTANFEVVLSSEVGQPTATVGIIVIFLLIGTVLLARQMRRSQAPLHETGPGEPDDESEET